MSKRKHHPKPEPGDNPGSAREVKTATRRNRFASILVAAGVIVAVAGFVTVSMWFSDRATGTIDICASEDPHSTDAIMLTVSEGWGRSHAYSNRSLFTFDVRTGKQGKSVNPGARSQCLGGLGANVVLDTSKDGIHVRNPSTGAIVSSEAELLGDLAKAKASWNYDRASHRLRVVTKFNDDFTLDLATHERWATSKAPAPTLGAPANDVVRLEFDSEYDRRAGIARGSSYTLACEGSRCKLATRAMNAYGNTIGVNPDVTPIPGADEVLVAKIVRYLPGEEGVLVSDLSRLDESARQLVLLGFDGKTKWTAPIASTPIDGFVVADSLVLGFFQPPRAPASDSSAAGHYANDELKVWVVGKENGRIRTTVEFPQRDVISGDVADVVRRFGDTLVVASHGEAVGLAIESGAQRWRTRY